MFRRSESTSLGTLTLLFTVAALTVVAFAGASDSVAVGTVRTSPAEVLVTTSYRGKHSDWVARLLARTGGYSCPDPAGEGGRPPRVRAEECMRDQYVAAAVAYAWAAECYAQNEEDNKAQEAAIQMYENLKSAQSLCSDAPTFSFGGPPKPCDTERIFRCGEIAD